MFRASIHYPAHPGARFDFDDYVCRHLPLARQLLEPRGLVRLEVDRGVSGEERGTASRYACVAHLYFEDADAFYDAMSAHGDALADDVPRYTDIAPEVHVFEILVP